MSNNVYWLIKLDAIVDAVGILAIVSCAIFVISVICTMSNYINMVKFEDSESKKFFSVSKKILTWSSIASVILVSALVFTPTTEEAIIMRNVNELVKEDQISEEKEKSVNNILNEYFKKQEE